MKDYGGSQAVTYTVKVVPLPSSRHHLSYDDCLEDKREKLSELFCAILCLRTTVVHNDMHTADGRFLDICLVNEAGINQSVDQKILKFPEWGSHCRDH